MALLSQQLRRFLDDQAYLENRRIMDILRGIEAGALAVRVQPPTGDFMSIADTAPSIELPMERPLHTPALKLSLESGAFAAGDEDMDAATLFSQFVIDKAALAEHVRQSLQQRTQITLVELLDTKGVTYRADDAAHWHALLQLQARVRDHVGMLGLELTLDEAEGCAFLRSRPEPDDPAVPKLPRLARRSLSFPVSLLLALPRKKLAEFDAVGSDTRLILSREQVVEMLRVFMPEGTNQTRLVDQVDTQLNRVTELGFVRRLRGHEQMSATSSIESKIEWWISLHRGRTVRTLFSRPRSWRCREWKSVQLNPCGLRSFLRSPNSAAAAVSRRHQSPSARWPVRAHATAAPASARWPQVSCLARSMRQSARVVHRSAGEGSAFRPASSSVTFPVMGASAAMPWSRAR